MSSGPILNDLISKGILSLCVISYNCQTGKMSWSDFKRVKDIIIAGFKHAGCNPIKPIELTNQPDHMIFCHVTDIKGFLTIARTATDKLARLNKIKQYLKSNGDELLWAIENVDYQKFIDESKSS